MSASKLPPALLVKRSVSFWWVLFCAVAMFGLTLAFACATLGVEEVAYLIGDASQTITLLLGGTLVLVLVLCGMALVRNPGIQRDNSEGLRLLALGEHDEALRIFRAVESRQRWLWSVRMVTRWNQAMVHVVAGRFDEALALYEVLGGEPYRRLLPYVWEGIPSMVALCHALRGELDWAEAALEEQRRRRQQRHTLSWVLPEAIVAVRRGNPAAAVELIQRERRALETAYAGVLGRALRLVEGLALEATGVDPAQVLGTAGPLLPSDVAWARAWPELEDFVARRGLVGNAA